MAGPFGVLRRGTPRGLLAAAMFVALLGPGAWPALAEDRPPPPPSPLEGEPGDFPEAVQPKAVARFEGTPTPGLRVKLRGDGSVGKGLRYRWVQTQGPPALLDDPTAGAATLTVPEGAETLGFLLVVSGPAGTDSAAVTIPVEPRDAARVAPAEPKEDAGLAPALRADAGDDQIGIVGRQLTLNGMRSEPKGRIGFRWLQVGGPEVTLKIEEGPIFAFVPPAPGAYRFALVVASGSAISEPDNVGVTVGGSAPPVPTSTAWHPTPIPTEEMARAALATVEGGAQAAEPLADAFDAIAGRMDLYRSYADAFSEVSRRLQGIVPDEPGRRALWIERVFSPLTARMVEALAAEGLDLRRPEGQAAQLTPAQRVRLAEHFRAMAAGFRRARPIEATTGMERGR